MFELMNGLSKVENSQGKYIWESLNSGAVPATTNANMFAYGDNVYLLTGDIASPGSTNELWRYNINDKLWVKLVCPLVLKQARTCSVVGNKAYFFGGYPTFNQTWVYDITADTWARSTDYPVNFYTGSSVAKGTDIYIFGGYSDSSNTWLSRCTRFDTLTGVMNNIVNLPVPLNGGAMAVFNDRYIDYMLSQDSSGNIRNGFRLDTVSQTWTDLPAIGRSVSYASCAQTPTKAYIFFGARGNTQNGEFTESDGVTFKPLTPIDPKPGPRSRAAMARLGNKLYLFGGTGTAGNLKDFWSFTI